MCLETEIKSLSAVVTQLIVVMEKYGDGVADTGYALEPTPALVTKELPAPAPEPAPTLDMTDMRKALIALQQRLGSEAPQAILHKLGVAKLSDLSEAQFPEVLTAIKNYAA